MNASILLSLAARVRARHAASAVCAAFMLCVAGPAASQAPNDPQKLAIDRIAEAGVRERDIPNLMIAVSQGGERRYYRYGAAGGSYFAADTIVEVGSITKVFTTALFAEAVQDGTMAAATPFANYLPTGVQVHSCAAQVTVRDLADFRSGMPSLPPGLPRRPEERSIDFFRVSDFYSWVSTFQPVSLEQYRGGGTARASCGLPATYQYSNASVGLLGLLTANAYRTSWNDLIASRITNPLDMRDTVVSPSSDQEPRVAQGHNPRGDPVGPWPVFAWFAAGALRSTTRDMLSFGEAALGHQTVSGRAVPAELIRALSYAMQPIYQPAGKPFKQGLAWSTLPLDTDNDNDAEIVFKDGGTNGFNSILVVSPTTDTVVFAVADKARSGVPALGIEVIRALSLRKFQR